MSSDFAFKAQMIDHSCDGHLMKKSPNHRFALGALALFFAALFTAYPCKATQHGAELCNPKLLAEGLRPLQGTWEGFSLNQEKPDGPPVKGTNTITVTVTGNSLHFQRDTNFWFETAITLPAGAEPQQLHATIKRGASSVGEVIVVIFKIEDGTLTLATDNGSGEALKVFEGAPNRYELRKVQSVKKDVEQLKATP